MILATVILLLNFMLAAWVSTWEEEAK